MKVLITGLNGTLAPHLARVADQHGAVVIAWPRASLAAEPSEAAQQWLAAQQPHQIYHLGMASEVYAGLLASYAAQRSIPLVFTSTAMVFDHLPNGPHRISDERTAKDDYGRYKLRCEDAIAAANPRAVIARIGYQMDMANPTGNNMIAHLDQQGGNASNIRASEAWFPATSLMSDTAQALWALGQHLQVDPTFAGVHHLDSNATDQLNYVQIVAALKVKLQRHWSIEATQDYVHDQRLINSRDASTTVAMPTLLSRLS
jgi:dTDP-4-dehydrorhamnose reductase